MIKHLLDSKYLEELTTEVKVGSDDLAVRPEWTADFQQIDGSRKQPASGVKARVCTSDFG